MSRTQLLYIKLLQQPNTMHMRNSFAFTRIIIGIIFTILLKAGDYLLALRHHAIYHFPLLKRCSYLLRMCTYLTLSHNIKILHLR